MHIAITVTTIIDRVVRVLIFQPRATVTKFGSTIQLVILKTFGNAAIKIYHSLYIFRHKNVLCTKEAFSEPQFGGKCPLGDVKKLLFTSFSTMCCSENLTSARANVLPEAVLGTLDFFLKQSDIKITILST